MSTSKLRSISTNSRLKINSKLDTSSVLSNVHSSLVNASTNSLSKSREKIPIKLPRLAPSSRGSSLETANSQDLSEDSISSLKHCLQVEWEKKSVPVELQKIVQDKIWSLPRHKAVAVASREVEDLKKNRSAMMTAIRAVTAREESLASIYEMENFLKQVPNWDKLKDVQLECAELLHAHRILSINAVESIEKWREVISFSALVNNETGSIHIPFVLGESNYLVKMRNDLDFLVDSEFRKVFNFQKNDPLLIKPSVPTIKIKEKKIDSNYFIQHGQVVVSLPSSLRLKVDMAEDLIAREIKFEHSLEPKHIEELTNVIYEELCEEEVTNDAVMYFGNNKSEVINPLSEALADDLIKTLLEEVAKDLKKDSQEAQTASISEALTEKIIEKEINDVLKQIAMSELKAKEKQAKELLLEQQRIKEENENLSRMIYNDLFNSLLVSMSGEFLAQARQDASEMAAKVKQVNQAKQHKEDLVIAERIANQYIEEEVAKAVQDLGCDLRSQQNDKKASEQLYEALMLKMIQEVAQESLDDSRARRDQAKAKTRDDLAGRILEALLDELVPDVQDLCQSAFDYELQLYSDRSELLENVGLGFVNEDNWEDFSGFVFKKIDAPDMVTGKLIEEYFPKIPDEELCVTADEEYLEQETSKIEAQWYWGLKGKIIVGLLVFSVDFDRNDVRVINVHHITCLNWKFYSVFIEQACKFIWDSDHCQEVRVNLYVSGNPEIPSHVKKIFNQLQFRWKTNFENEEEEISIVVMGKLRPQIKLSGLSPKKKNLIRPKGK